MVKVTSVKMMMSTRSGIRSIDLQYIVLSILSSQTFNISPFFCDKIDREYVVDDK